MRFLKIGTRKSPLAMKQVEEVLESLKKSRGHMRVKIVGIDTYGDKDRLTPISDIEGTDFFTREIDEALLAGRIDIAVHSAKDLPDKIRGGLYIAAITKSIDPYDALVSKNDLKLDELPRGARVGTSSERRKAQLAAYRSDFEIVDIRGKIEERLAILDGEGIGSGKMGQSPSPFAKASGDLSGTVPIFPKLLDFNERRTTNDERRNLDAVIIAACALLRLGLERRISQRIPFEILRPHPLQGSLAIAVREGDRKLIELLAALK